MCGAIEEENFWVNAAPYRTASLGAVESHKRENRINKASGTPFVYITVSISKWLLPSGLSKT